MRKITLNIPDENYSSFMDIIRSLSFVREFNEDDLFVPGEEKNLIRARIKNTKPEQFLDWEDIKDSYKLD